MVEILKIKSATFKVAKEYTKDGTPTGAYRFLSTKEFVDNDPSKELIEIGWDTAPSDFKEFENQHNVVFKCGSPFSMNGMNPRFVKREDD